MSRHGTSPSLPRGEWALLIALALAIIVLKVAVAAQLPLFGDEAFYWWESRYPAWGYSELPPLTQWLLAATVPGEASYLGVRWAFLILGTLIPVLVFRLAREIAPPAAALLAALVAFSLPLVATQGLLALPDVLLNVMSLLLAISLVRVSKQPRFGWWLAAGIAVALGLATHYRFAPIAAAAALAVLTVQALRTQLTTSGPWLAALVGLLGLVPTALFNLQSDFATVRFQLVDRHPWSFQPEALGWPVVQAAVTTPVLFVVLAAAALVLVRRARSDGVVWAVLAWLALLPVGVYFAVGLFADAERVGFHWPLAGYLALCAVSPLVAALQRPWFRRVALGLGLLASLATLGGLWWLARHPQQSVLVGELYPDNALGWPSAAAMARAAGDGPLIADNFMLGAELAHALDRHSVFVLDHPLNARHGRALQLAIWGLDEASLPHPIDEGVLMVEETALDAAARPAWARLVCALFPSAQLVEDRMLHGGRKRFRSFRLGEGRCDHPSFAYVDAPARDAVLLSPFTVRGWAFDDDQGVERIEVLLDGVPVAETVPDLSRPEVAEFFAGSTDPRHPKVGFETVVAAPPGKYQLSLRLHAVDGSIRETRPMRVVVAR